MRVRASAAQSCDRNADARLLAARDLARGRTDGKAAAPHRIVDEGGTGCCGGPGSERGSASQLLRLRGLAEKAEPLLVDQLRFSRRRRTSSDACSRQLTVNGSC